MKRIITFVCGALLVPALAAAQPRTPDDWYKEGETQYNLGNFIGAVDAFKKGFELEPNESKKSAYLYNVAQAYRQAKDCSNAQFFYKRYLALKENDTKKPLKPEKRQEIEERIKELDECARQQEVIRQKPPDQNLRPDEGDKTPVESDKRPAGDKRPSSGDKRPGSGEKRLGSGDKRSASVDKRSASLDKNARKRKRLSERDKSGDETGDEGDDEDRRVIRRIPDEPPRVLSVRLQAGGAKVKTGELAVPIQATVALFAGYPLALAPALTLDIGAGYTFTPVPFESMGVSNSAALSGIMADLGLTYMVVPHVGVRADAGAGALLFTGASESPFTGNAPTTGALTMFHVRVAISADIDITSNLLATLTPFAYSYSPPKVGLREDIKSITAIDFMIGLGYRM